MTSTPEDLREAARVLRPGGRLAFSDGRQVRRPTVPGRAPFET